LGHDTMMTAMAASPDSRYIATGSTDGTVIIWRGATGPQKMLLEMPRSAESKHVFSLHFSDTSEFLAGICAHNLLIWRVIDGVQVTSVGGVLPLFREEVHGLSISPLHSFLLAWSFDIVSVVRRTTTRTAQGCLAHDVSLHIILHGHEEQVRDGCFSPCERYIATACHDFTVRLWSTRDGELLWTFRDHDNMVTEVVFSPDGRVLASVDDDGRVRIRPLSMFVRDVPVSSVNNT
ncbi:WD40 repeat-like protein, partial [Polyporus arcularius HHB13444]